MLRQNYLAGRQNINHYEEESNSVRLNPAFRENTTANTGWFSDHYSAINEGLVVLMIENYRSGLIWRLFGSSPYTQKGLKQAGFRSNR